MSDHPTTNNYSTEPATASLNAAWDALYQGYLDVVNNRPGGVERFQVASDRLKALRGDA